MRYQTARTLAAASLLSVGLATWPGCSGDTPQGAAPATVEAPPASAPPAVATRPPAEAAAPAGATVADVPTAPDPLATLDRVGKKIGDEAAQVEEAGAKGLRQVKDAGAGRLKQVEDAGASGLNRVKDAGLRRVDATGRELEKLGDKAAGLIDGLGKGLDEGARKVDDTVRPK